MIGGLSFANDADNRAIEQVLLDEFSFELSPTIECA